MLYLVICFLLVCLVCFTFPRPRDLSKFTSEIVRNIPSRQLAELSQFSEAIHLREEGAEFWDTSRKLKGIWDRLCYAFQCFRIVRGMHAYQVATTRDLWYVAARLSLMTAYSLKAVIEVPFCLVIPHRTHVAALMAVQFYADLLEFTCVLSGTSRAKTSMPTLDHLL